MAVIYNRTLICGLTQFIGNVVHWSLVDFNSLLQSVVTVGLCLPFVLFPSPPGARSQVVLTQSGPALKKPGESHTLQCATSGFTLSSTAMSWIRQEPGKGLEWLWVARISSGSGSSTYCGDAVTARFTISRDSPNTLLYLQLTGLRAEDTARYHCTRDTPCTLRGSRSDKNLPWQLQEKVPEIPGTGCPALGVGGIHSIPIILLNTLIWVKKNYYLLFPKSLLVNAIELCSVCLLIYLTPCPVHCFTSISLINEQVSNLARWLSRGLSLCQTHRTASVSVKGTSALGFASDHPAFFRPKWQSGNPAAGPSLQEGLRDPPPNCYRR
uniref:Ig-like domain-containing protein n=1 Tax=Chrysemys picta bellii TaxID=8478 RepID=A0A8C3HVH6_CHRPI